MKPLLILALLASSLIAERIQPGTTVSPSEEPQTSSLRRGPAGHDGAEGATLVPVSRRDGYRISQVALVVSTIADVAFSADAINDGRAVEANPLMSSDGRIGARGYAVGAGITVGILVAQRFITRRWPKSRSWLRWMNFGASGMHSYLAVRAARIGGN